MGAHRDVVVDTTCGRIRGLVSNGCFRFLGVRYAADTQGPNRFQPPRPVRWAGIRDASQHGPRSPQNEAATTRACLTWLRDPGPCGEDCLVLNVFTTAVGDAIRKPVMVYLHGGAFASGSGGAPGLDGSNLARLEVVVVTLNHRLNLFGHLYLGEADGGRYIDSGNAGLLDIVEALNWVRDNISRFGGDPRNVTIFGQSGGGSKVAALMAMPLAKGLFHKAIIQSASSVFSMASVEAAERNTDHFLSELRLDRANLGALQGIPVDVLLKAMPNAIRSAGGLDNYRPTVDGRTLACLPFEPPAAELSRGIPLLTGWCENEQRLTFAKSPELYGQSWQQARSSLAAIFGPHATEVEALIAAYRAERSLDSPGDIHAQILGDHRYRRTVTRAAELHGLHGCAPVFMYLLRWKTPAEGGALRTPHTLCIPFAFRNADVASGITGGAAEDCRALEQEMSHAWAAFAKNGKPDHAGLPEWRPYSLPERATMVFDRATGMMADPLAVERRALESYPPYVAAIGEGKLRV